MSTNNKSATFGSLLKGAISGIAYYEGKTAPIVEDELGALIGVAGRTIQNYKAGSIPSFDRENDAVRILAEAAVTRGFLGREWLERFLRAAHYPAADRLLNELCPAPTLRPRPERLYKNLPAPTYSQFVMRQEAFDEVVDGLRQRSAAVLIVGMGGNGKTSLAREVAAHCLQETETAPRFDAAVWVSDKDSPGTTNLSTVLDTIARTLDYPGFTQFAHEEKRYEVEQLLRRQQVLLIIDNAETITDGALFTWLLRLPEPSKAVITTREYHRLFRRNSTPVELRGMSDAEAGTLLHQRLELLRIAHLVHDEAQLAPLLAATGGNPKAITMVAGLLKYERRPLQQIVDDLYAARGELFDDLFSRAWALLDEAGRRMLMVMTFFPDSASSEALGATADVRGFDFDRAVERLTDLSLLDVQQVDLMSEPRYVLHPLVRAFAVARLAEQPDFEQGARGRWSQFFLDFAARYARWEQVSERYWYSLATDQTMFQLDPEWANLQSTLEWADKNAQYDLLVDLMMYLVHQMDTRGLFIERIHYVRRAIEAALQLGQTRDAALFEIDGLGWTLVEEDRYDEAEAAIMRGLKHVQISDIGSEDQNNLEALGYAHLARVHLRRGDTQAALEWIKKTRFKDSSGSVQVTVLMIAGEIEHDWGCLEIKAGAVEKASTHFQEAILYLEQSARCDEDVRGFAATFHATWNRLASVYLAQGELQMARETFHKVLSNHQRVRRTEHIRATYGLSQVAEAEGDIETAYEFAKEAFEKLFRLRVCPVMLNEIKSFLASLEAQMAAAATE